MLVFVYTIEFLFLVETLYDTLRLRYCSLPTAWPSGGAGDVPGTRVVQLSLKLVLGPTYVKDNFKQSRGEGQLYQRSFSKMNGSEC